MPLRACVRTYVREWLVRWALSQPSLSMHDCIGAVPALRLLFLLPPSYDIACMLTQGGGGGGSVSGGGRGPSLVRLIVHSPRTVKELLAIASLS